MEKLYNNKCKKLNLIDKGGYGEVIKVLSIEDNQIYAIKILYKSEKDKFDKKKLNDIQSFKDEINIMKELKGENFVNLNEYFEDNEGYYIVMEYCDCNLSDLLNSKYQQGMSIEMIKKIFFQLNNALLLMNKSNITHRNLKPTKILIKYLNKDFDENNFVVKLSDFRLSFKLSITQSDLSFSGTFDYMAPEVENIKYSNKVDLWSIGIILYELKTCEYIFKGKNKEEENYNKYNGIIKKTGFNDLDNLISNLIVVDTKLRISWENYFKHNFFNKDEPLPNYEFKKQPPHLGTGKKFIKIGFIGSALSGRSVLIYRYIYNIFKKQQVTLGIKPFLKEIEFFNEKICLILYDIGAENAKNYLPNLNFNIIIINFDITNECSFDKIELYRHLIDEIGKKTNIAICACKCDKIEEKIEEEKIKKYCKQNEFSLYFTSSKLNEGINEMFNDLVIKALNSNNYYYEIKEDKKNKKNTCNFL